MHFTTTTTVRAVTLPSLAFIATALFIQGVIFTQLTSLFVLCTIVSGALFILLFVCMLNYFRDQLLAKSVMKTAGQLLQAYHDLGMSFDVIIGLEMQGPLVKQEGGRYFLSVRAHDGVEYRDYVITDDGIGLEYQTYSTIDGSTYTARSYILEYDEVKLVRDCLRHSLMTAQNLLGDKARLSVSA